MNTNDNLIPQIFGQELNLSKDIDSTLSFANIEVATGKSFSEIADSISESLRDLPIEKVKEFWGLLDTSSKSELTFIDYGKFNLDLVRKLNIKGDELYTAFVHNLQREIYELDFAPLSEPQYSSAFERIQTELLSVCKQLFGAGNFGRERLLAFIGCFDIELLTGFVRHEIAVYYIDERGAELEWDIVETDEGNALLETDNNNDEDIEELDIDREFEKNDLLEIKRIVEQGNEIPNGLLFTFFVQNFLPETFEDIRNQLLFDLSGERFQIWDRPNPLQPDENSSSTQSMPNLEPQTIMERMFGKKQESNALVHSYMEKETNRIIRLFVIGHPLKKDFEKIYLQDFEKQGKMVAKILAQSGKDCTQIQTFDDLRKALFDAIGFTAIKQWLGRQENSKQLIESSGKSYLLDEMKVLGIGVFGDNNLIAHSLDASRREVNKLYGWFCLLKIFWNITKQNKRFLDLAMIKNDTIVWDETIALNTLIFQTVLSSESMFFSLKDVISFCEAAKEKDWEDTLKEAFTDLAIANDANSTIPIFHNRIELLRKQTDSIFYVSENILLASKKEREVVATIRSLVKQFFDDYITSTLDSNKDEEEIKLNMLLVFSLQVSSIPELAEYLEYANQLADLELSKGDLGAWVPEGVNPNDYIRQIEGIDDDCSNDKKQEEFKDNVDREDDQEE